MMKILLFFLLFVSFAQSQNDIEFSESNCLLDSSSYRSLGAQKQLFIEQGLQIKQVPRPEKQTSDRLFIVNNSDTLKLTYYNGFYKKVDTTFYNARELSEITLCVERFEDFEKESIIERAINENIDWTTTYIQSHYTYNKQSVSINVEQFRMKIKYQYVNGLNMNNLDTITFEKSFGLRERGWFDSDIIESINKYEKKLELINEDSDCSTYTEVALDSGDTHFKKIDTNCNSQYFHEFLEELNIPYKY